MNNEAKRPDRNRHRPRKLALPPDDVDLAAIAEQVEYIGSPEHKSAPSFAGSPRPRADATLCDISLQRGEITEWLKNAIRLGATGTWEGRFPRYVWYKDGDTMYEGRLTNPVQGQYKGYPLRSRDEWPNNIERIYE